MRADREFVTEWSQRYLIKSSLKAREEEEDLLTKVGPAVRQRGFYTVIELERVYRWKLRDQRNRGRLALNSPAQVKSITKTALAAPEHLQLYAIQRLHGVGDAVASALLMFPFPDRHTILDFRAARALEAFAEQGQLPDELLWRPQPPDSTSRPPYPPYLDACRRLATHLSVSLRDLDRALWQWQEERSAARPRTRSEVGASRRR